MNCARCDGCGGFFSNLDAGDRSYPIHRIVMDSVREVALCDRCLAAFDMWLVVRLRSMVGGKFYRASLWTGITKRFRRWLTKLAVNQIQGGNVVIVSRPSKADANDEKLDSPFSQPTPP